MMELLLLLSTVWWLVPTSSSLVAVVDIFWETTPLAESSNRTRGSSSSGTAPSE
jgi:hypothetical protein